jgi:rhodanese-related sulfurtransferase
MHATVLWLFVLATVLGVGAESEQIPSTITQQELLQRLEVRTDLFMLDVRTPQEFAAGHIPGAVNVPHTTLSERLEALQSYQDKEIIVYCEAGVRSAKAEKVLRQAGFAKVRHLEGDMAAWRRSSLPLGTQGR